MIGTAKKAPTIPLSSKPSFTSIARLDIPFSALTEVLRGPGLSKQSGTADPGTLAVDWKAMPRHQKCLGRTWVGPRRHRASPVHPTRAGLQSRWIEVVDRLPEQGKIHLQPSCPCSLRGRSLHDTRSNTFDTHRHPVADLREPVLHKAAESHCREYRVSPKIGFLARASRPVCR